MLSSEKEKRILDQTGNSIFTVKNPKIRQTISWRPKIVEPKLPKVLTQVDSEARNAVLSVPYLKNCAAKTGEWGRNIADVEILQLPEKFVAQVLLVPSSDNPESEFNKDEVLLIVALWTRNANLGWSESFEVGLKFPDGSQYLVEVPNSLLLIDGCSLSVSVDPGTIVRERTHQLDRVIPRIVYNLSTPLVKRKSVMVRDLLKNGRRLMNILQCTSLYLIIEDEAMDSIVENSEIPNFATAFRSLVPGSYKADLVRYYLLYRYGGVYLDDKSILRYSLDSKEFDSILGPAPNTEGKTVSKPTDLALGVTGDGFPEISFMAARPGSPILRMALEKSIENILSRWYGSDRLDITGNTMLQSLMIANTPQSFIPLGSRSIFAPPPFDLSGGVSKSRVEVLGDSTILMRMSPNLHIIQYGNEVLWMRCAISFTEWPQPANYYWTLWNNSQVYVDGNRSRSFESVFQSMAGTDVFTAIALTFLFLGLLGITAFILSANKALVW